MKTLFKTILLAAAALTSIQSHAQLPGKFGMSMAPGQLSNTATFSYRAKNFQPYLGFQMMSMGATLNSAWQEFNSNGDLVNAFDKSSLNLKLYIPQIGCRYNFKSSEQFTLFANAGLSTIMMRGSSGVGGTQPTLSDVLKANKIWGAQAGFGAEYFFSNHFSIGGEYGIRTMQVKNNTSFQQETFDPNSGNTVMTNRTESLKMSATPTYGKLFFSFYF